MVVILLLVDFCISGNGGGVPANKHDVFLSMFCIASLGVGLDLSLLSSYK